MTGDLIINTGGDYSKFSRVREALQAAGMGDPNKYIIQPKTLRVEQLLSTTRDTYEFQLYETPGAGRDQEIKLNRNDMFFISAIAVYVYKQNTSTTPAQYANTQKFTYPDTNFFPGAAGGTTPFEWMCLYLVWRGKLSLFTDPVQRIKDLDTSHMMYVPRRQYLESAFVGITSDTYPEFGPEMQARGFFELPAMPALYGQQNNRLSLELGSGDKSVIDGAVDAAGNSVNTRNVLQIALHGFNVENGAEAQGRWGAL